MNILVTPWIYTNIKDLGEELNMLRTKVTLKYEILKVLTSEFLSQNVKIRRNNVPALN